MDLDPVRVKLLQLIRSHGTDMKAVSKAIGRNPSYLQQFLFRGTPRILPGEVRLALSEHFGVDAEELSHKLALPRSASPRQKRPGAGTSAHSETRLPVDDLVAIPEIDVRAAAGPGALNEDQPETLATWHLPAGLLQHELRARGPDVRLMSVRGDSMWPTLSDGDRILVDLSHHAPSPPGIFVLWDGFGLVTKRVDRIPGGEQPKIRLVSDNDAYPAYDCDVQDINVVGRVIWAGKRL
jgi:phage repressor protein C with HTH and peptisase S24 domain